MTDLGVRPVDKPQFAWRYWRLHPGPYRLQSVSQRGVVWQPGKPLRAVCLADSHPAPDPHCACGVYGALDLEGLRNHSLCLSPGPLVTGEVALWGPVVADEDGYRARYGYPRRLWLVADSLDDAERAPVLDDLAVYGVSVGQMSLADAVGEASMAIMGFLAMSAQQEPEPTSG
jgi:hypothetical protein